MVIPTSGFILQLTTVSASHAADDNDTAVLLVFRSRVGIVALARRLGHGRRAILQREERRHAVGFEAFLQIGRCGCLDGWRTEEARGTYPNIEAA